MQLCVVVGVVGGIGHSFDGLSSIVVLRDAPLLDLNTKAMGAPSFRRQIHSEPGCAALRLVTSCLYPPRSDLGLACLPSLYGVLVVDSVAGKCQLGAGVSPIILAPPKSPGGKAQEAHSPVAGVMTEHSMGSLAGVWRSRRARVCSAVGHPPVKPAPTRSFLSCSFIWRCRSFPTKDRGRSGKMAGASGRTHSNC